MSVEKAQTLQHHLLRETQELRMTDALLSRGTPAVQLRHHTHTSPSQSLSITPFLRLSVPNSLASAWERSPWKLDYMDSLLLPHPDHGT